MHTLNRFWNTLIETPAAFERSLGRSTGNLTSEAWSSLVFAVEGLLLSGHLAPSHETVGYTSLDPCLARVEELSWLYFGKKPVPRSRVERAQEPPPCLDIEGAIDRLKRAYQFIGDHPKAVSEIAQRPSGHQGTVELLAMMREQERAARRRERYLKTKTNNARHEKHHCKGATFLSTPCAAHKGTRKLAEG